MTSQHRDFDRLARAWLELGPDEAPDRPIAAVLQAIETTPQVRRPWRWPVWRSPTMSRITILAVLAGTLALVIGGLVLSGGGPGPTPISVPSAEPSPGEAGAPVPDAIKGGWSAASRGTAMEGAAVTTIVLGGSAMDSSARQFSMDYPGMPSRRLDSNLVEIEPGVLRFRLGPGSSGCDVGAEGRYRWSVSADGQWLTLEQITEACPVRGEILAGTWQRNIGFSNPGGPGIATAFMPYMTVALPDQAWTGNEFGNVDTILADREDRTFKVWKDLDGFVDPCDRDRGRLLIDPGMDAFLAYLRDDPRFTVSEEREFQLDGHRAVEVIFQVGADITAPCWNLDGDPANPKTGVLLWVPEAEPNPEFIWNGTIGDPGMNVVTEVDGVTLTFEAAVLEDGVWRTDRETLDTVRFHDTLPTPPAP